MPHAKRRKPYRPRPIKNTMHLFCGREPPPKTEATTLKIVYSSIFERVRTGTADERDLWSMGALLEKLHIAVEHADNLDDKETTFAQLREAYSHIKHAIDHKRTTLSGEGLQMLRDAVALNGDLIDHSSEYILRQIISELSRRAANGIFRVAQQPISGAEMLIG